MKGFPLVKSIFILKAAPFSGYFPSFIAANSRRFSSIGRSRWIHGAGFPLPPPRASAMVSSINQIVCEHPQAFSTCSSHASKRAENRLTITMTNKSFATTSQLGRISKQLIEVITSIGDFPRFVSKPSNGFQDGIKVDTFFSRRICVVESDDRDRAVSQHSDSSRAFMERESYLR